jgi:uncharacterized membrane protein YjjB (DUF3815 family)
MQRNGVTNDLLSTALSEGLTATFVVAALAVGLAVPGLFVFRRRPVI